MLLRGWSILVPLMFVLAMSHRHSIAQPSLQAQPQFKSPLGLAVDETGEKAYVALHAADRIAVVDLKAGQVLHEITVGKGPHDLVQAKGTAHVTCEEDNTLVTVDLAKQVVRQRARVGPSPQGLALSPDATQVFVACRDDSTLRWWPGDAKPWHSSQVPAWPDRLAWGGYDVGLTGCPTLYVLSAEAGRGTVNRVNAGSRLQSIRNLELAGASNLRGLAAIKENTLLVAHQRPKSNVPATQVVQGWVFTNAISLVEFRPRSTLVRTAVLDEPNRGVADPSDVVVAPDGKHVFIAAAGADTVLVMDLEKFENYQRRHLKSPMGPSPVQDYPSASDDLSASRHYIVARLATQANPRRLALSGDGKTLVVSNYLADSLTVIDAERLQVLRHIPVGGCTPDAVRRGEILFNSGKMTFQGQFTCASCHPRGDTDGLNWDLTRDGIGNFKNTKSLLGVKDTAPYGWHGSSPTLADRVRGTLRTLHRHEPIADEISDLVAYLGSLPPPRPLPQKEADQSALARGRALFEGKGRCTSCHHRAALDDGQTHDVGTRGPGDTQAHFDTPALRGVARTAPYLHDGCALTLEEVFTKYNPQRRHGAAHTLTKEELADLIVYLKSL
jgi:YVTN family beta-propeller protein